MTFDINPVGNQMHLKQLEAEAENIHRYSKTAETADTQPRKETIARARWIGRRIVEAFSAPRYAG